MAHPDPIEEQVLLSVAEQLSRYKHMPVLVSPDPFETIELAESFSVWTLPEKSLLNGNRLQERASKTGTWVHQIDAASYKRSKREARLYARATSLERDTPPGLTLLSVDDAQASTSPPTLMRDAAKWIDVNVSGDPLVRYLMITPLSNQIFLFWLQYGEKDSVVVIQKPDSRLDIQYKKEYGFDEAAALF